jgi:hypothetical protein
MEGRQGRVVVVVAAVVVIAVAVKTARGSMADPNET